MKSIVFILLFLNYLSLQAQIGGVTYTDEPGPEQLLPDFVDIQKIKYTEKKHYETDTSGQFLKFSSPTIIFINNYPYYFMYTVAPTTKDTLKKSVYKYYEDKNTLEFYQEYGIGNSRHCYYNKNGQIIKKETYFNNDLESAFNWYYNEKGNIVKEEKISYWKSKQSQKLTFEFFYNELNQLSERRRAYNDKLLERIVWYYDKYGNIVKEEGYFNDEKYTVEKSYDGENRLIESKEYKNDSLIKVTDYSRFHDEKHIEEEKLREEKYSNFLKRKTTTESDKQGNWIKSMFLSDEKYFESDRISGNYIVTERHIIYK